MKRTLVRLAIIVVAAILVVYGGILLWTKVINKPEEKLGTDDLSAVVDPTTSESSPPAATDAPTTPDGTWVATSASTLGYRVPEVLGGVDTEGVGRTNQVKGSITVAGTMITAASFSVDVATITSDSSRRDGQFIGPIMDTATYPTATFELTQPIELGAIPEPGTQITATATGALTMRGTTVPVTFTVTAEYSPSTIGVFGSIPIVFADYGIPNPSNPFVTTGDSGLLEFVLAFARS
ncbi:MAG: YceI family protein [Ilumatobacteraceae bacterium]